MSLRKCILMFPWRRDGIRDMVFKVFRHCYWNDNIGIKGYIAVMAAI